MFPTDLVVPQRVPPGTFGLASLRPLQRRRTRSDLRRSVGAPVDWGTKEEPMNFAHFIGDISYHRDIPHIQ